MKKPAYYEYSKKFTPTTYTIVLWLATPIDPIRFGWRNGISPPLVFRTSDP
jgi:hypothetical protein